MPLVPSILSKNSPFSFTPQTSEIYMSSLYGNEEANDSPAYSPPINFPLFK